MTKTFFEGLESRTLMSTYYVANNGVNGSSGDASAPWKTLQYAADRVQPGDTVIVKKGHYTGFDIRRSGTAAKRITFKAERGAVIDKVNSKTSKDGINIENASYIIVDGFTLSGTGNPSTSRAGIRIVGDGYNYDDGRFSKAVIISNNKCFDWGQWGILTGFCDDMVIQNNTAAQREQHGIYFSNSGDRPTIRNNTVYGNANCGIHMNADIETGDTSNPKVDGIITGANVEGNTVYENGGGSSFSAGGGSAINCDGVRDSRFVNNVLYDNHATGIGLYQIDAAAPAVNNVIANNTVINAADSRWCLLIVDGAVNTTVFNNIFLNLHSYRGSIDISADSMSGLVSDFNITDGKFSYAEDIGNFNEWCAQTGGDSHSRVLNAGQIKALFNDYNARDFSLKSACVAVNRGTSGLTNGSMRNAPINDRIRSVRPMHGRCDIGAYESLVA